MAVTAYSVKVLRLFLNLEKECFTTDVIQLREQEKQLGTDGVGGRQRHVDLSNFKPSMVYIMTFKKARAIESPCLKNKTSPAPRPDPPPRLLRADQGCKQGLAPWGVGQTQEMKCCPPLRLSC